MTDVPAAAGRAAGTARQGLIGRHDLVATLDRAVSKRVTIVSAPPGSGKTSLLHAWADRREQNRRNTVNTHIRRIYAKLGATDRSSAVQRGRELRLLSSGRA
jgi:ATP/maltotriose-dependent transcriptional regulator MalT